MMMLQPWLPDAHERLAMQAETNFRRVMAAHQPFLFPPFLLPPPPPNISDDDAMCAAALVDLGTADDDECQFPFLVKLRQIIKEEHGCVRWNEQHRELEILDKVRLETEIMPKYFTTHGPRARFASFSRQLNNYGFENTLRGRKGCPVYKNCDPTIATVDDFKRVQKVCSKKARATAAAKPSGDQQAAGLVLALNTTKRRSLLDDGDPHGRPNKRLFR